MGGGMFGAPITSLDDYYNEYASILQIVDIISPVINGKKLYKRIVYKLRDDINEVLENFCNGGDI